MPTIQITHIAIRNLCGARNVEIPFNAARTIIAGGNAEGKTSLRDAIALALTKAPSRVEPKKKAMAALISDGAKAATVSVGITQDGEPMAATFKLPSLEGISPRLEEPQASCLPLVINPPAFASLTADSRRHIIQALFGIGAGPTIPKRLAEEGLPADKIDMLSGLLASGFDAAVTFSNGKATEARAAWKAIAGENYGSIKAEGWAAPKPEVDTAALAEAVTARAQLEAKASELRGQLAVIKDRNQSAEKQEARRLQLQTLTNDIEHRQQLLDLAIAELEDFRPKVDELRRRAEARRPVLPEIAHRLAVDLRDSLLTTGANSEALAEYDDMMNVTVDIEAQARLPENEKGLAVLERMFTTRTAALDEAKNARVILSELPPPGTSEDTTALDAQVKELEAQIGDLNRTISAQEAKQSLFSVADENTAKAANYHADVKAWTKAAELLGPDGIPAEYMAKALQKINHGMAGHAMTMREYDLKWPTVTIAPDMDVLGNGRPYGLLSESEKWRCDFLLAYAVAAISGLKFMLADRMDVLEVSARDAVINWMDVTANSGVQVIALGTFKQALRGLPHTIETYWIQDGELVAEPQAQAA